MTQYVSQCIKLDNFTKNQAKLTFASNENYATALITSNTIIRFCFLSDLQSQMEEVLIESQSNFSLFVTKYLRYYFSKFTKSQISLPDRVPVLSQLELNRWRVVLTVSSAMRLVIYTAQNPIASENGGKKYVFVHNENISLCIHYTLDIHKGSSFMLTWVELRYWYVSIYVCNNLINLIAMHRFNK